MVAKLHILEGLTYILTMFATLSANSHFCEYTNFGFRFVLPKRFFFVQYMGFILMIV